MQLVKTLLFCFFILIGSTSYAQKTHYWSVQPTYGAHLIPEDNDSLIHDPIYGVDISYGKQLDSSDGKWVRFFNAKYLQFAFIALDLSQLRGFYDPNPTNFLSNYIPNGLGQHYGLISSAQIQLFQIKKQFHAYFLPGFGISYLTRTYFDDKQNRFIGSHINYTIRFEVLLQQKISTNWAATAGFNGIHFSNGGFTVPNAGVNALCGKVGVCWLVPQKNK